MPEIKIKHVVSFSSEDKVHKAENLIKSETYRKWKCATPGEKSATVILQFEKATQIHSIDIGNECSAFVEVLVGRSSDTVSDYQVLLVASSFMSPLESRNSEHTNRVRMFGPEKLSKSTRDEKWDCVQVVCTQPFNKNITFGLSFIKFHSPSEKIEEHSRSPEAGTAVAKLGSFKLKPEDEDEDESLLPVGSWFAKQKNQFSQSPSSSTAKKNEPSCASPVLASTDSTAEVSLKNTPKRKSDEANDSSDEPPIKKASTTMNKDHIVYKDVLRDAPENKKTSQTKGDLTTSENKETSASATLNTESTRKVPKTNGNLERNASSSKPLENKKTPAATALNKPAVLTRKVPFDKIMDKVVFVLSGFVNPLRSELREKALEMGAKYKADWDSTCTHLVCAFANTPKFQQVKQLKGRVVTKEWILDCYKKKMSIPWTRYMLGKSSKDSSEDSSEEENYSEESEEESEFSEECVDSEEEYTDKKKKRKKKNAKTVKNKPPNTKKNAASNKKETNAASDKKRTAGEADQSSNSTKATLNVTSKNHSDTPNKKDVPSTSTQGTAPNNSKPSAALSASESETEDEEAIRDYLANTDVEDDSGGDTEDEIRKVEMAMQNNGNLPKKAKSSPKKEENCEYSEKPDVTDLPLPELPNLFKQKHFFLFGDFSPSKQHDLYRYIVAYNGIIEDYMGDKVKYVVTESKWDKNFEDALSENEDLIFVKPAWIYKCHDAKKLLPYQPHIVIPDS